MTDPTGRPAVPHGAVPTRRQGRRRPVDVVRAAVPAAVAVVIEGGVVQGARRPSPETHGVEGLAVVPVHVALKQVNFGLVRGERGGVGAALDQAVQAHNILAAGCQEAVGRAAVAVDGVRPRGTIDGLTVVLPDKVGEFVRGRRARGRGRGGAVGRKGRACIAGRGGERAGEISFHGRTWRRCRGDRLELFIFIRRRWRVRVFDGGHPRFFAFFTANSTDSMAPPF
mmetsp:Transcript_17306/g.34444  ORF Transcript_17306/g.34444 Transcript_17306/m.34444 type:complete len:226 (-) Transcript_17306:17-694(-)